MKKNNLFKVIAIVVIAYVLLTWIAPIFTETACTDQQNLCQIGITSIFSIMTEAFSGFGTYVFFVLMVGAFYGVLKAAGAYDSMIDSLVKKSIDKELIALIVVTICMTVISSFVGLELGLLIIIPFLIGFINRLGYDKIVALTATVGAAFVGMFGSIFNGALYGINNSVFSLEKFDSIIAKIVLLVVGIIALSTFMIFYIKNNAAFNIKEIKLDAKKESNKKGKKVSSKKDSSKDKSSSKVEIKKDEVKKEEKKKEEKQKDKKVSADKKQSCEITSLRGFVIYGVMSLVMIIATIPWGSIFSKNIFETIHTKWTTVQIGGFDIFNKILGGVSAFGSNDWIQGPSKYQTYSIVLILTMIVIAIAYRKKACDLAQGFIDGIKSYIVPMLIVTAVSAVFVFVYYSPVISNITNELLDKDFNIASSGIYVIINSIFYVDYYYLANSLLYKVSSVYSDASTLSVVSIMFTSLYSLVMMIGPTSALLLVTLSLTDVDYTAWVKHIGKLVLPLLVLSFAVFSFMLGYILFGILFAGFALLLFAVLNSCKYISIASLAATLIALTIYFFVIGNILVGAIFAGIIAAIIIICAVIFIRTIRK